MHFCMLTGLLPTGTRLPHSRDLLPQGRGRGISCLHCLENLFLEGVCLYMSFHLTTSHCICILEQQCWSIPLSSGNKGFLEGGLQQAASFCACDCCLPPTHPPRKRASLRKKAFHLPRKNSGNLIFKISFPALACTTLSLWDILSLIENILEHAACTQCHGLSISKLS